MEELINYIQQFVKLDRAAIDELYLRTEVEQYAKNAHILEAGKRCHKIWFLKSGMVRKYYLHEGKEITVWIHTENETFTALQSYAQQIPSNEYLQACEPTEVISITRSNSEKLSRFPQFVAFSNAMMEREFVQVDVNTKAMNQLDAKGRYAYLRQIAPKMVNRAKLGHIASVIGVSQETLSRIRKG